VEQLLDKRVILNTVLPLPIGSRITVQWTTIGQWDMNESSGTVVARHTDRVDVHYHDLGVFPLPPADPSVGILRVISQAHPLTLKPLRKCNRPLDLDRPELSHHVYVDGGARPSNGGPGAAAFHVIDNSHTQSHSRFYANTTNNIAEFIALIGALRWLARHDDIQLAVIVLDSEIVYEALLGNRTISDRKLTPLLAEARTLFTQLCGRIILGHMLRKFGNYADSVATRAIASASGEGEITLFPDIPVPPAPAKKRAPVATVHGTDAPLVTANAISSVDDFARVRFLKTRSRAPDTAEHLWSALASATLRKAIQTTDDSLRDKFFIDFLLCPTAYLPLRCGTKKIVKHLSSGEPFAARLIHADDDDTPRAPAPPNVRLTEAITRLAKDFKLRAANTLLKSQADAAEIPFAEKLSALREKILDQPVHHSQLAKANISIISHHEVITAIHRVSRQAATSIDGWTKDLLTQAIQHNPTFATDLGVWLTSLLTDSHSELWRSCILASRLVGLPKEPSGVRPVCIANIFLKILGIIATERDARGVHSHQWAINRKHGCHHVIHIMRTAARQGKAVVKFDMTNAYNALKRSAMESTLRQADGTLQAYFRMVYQGTSTLCVYGPNKQIAHLPLAEGVRQGDSTASYIFCHSVDNALARLVDLFPDAHMYMDDLTVACDPAAVDQLVSTVESLFSPLGLIINRAKTAVLYSGANTFSIPKKTSNFVILGADISDRNDEFINKMWHRQRCYFDILKTTPLHPQIIFTLARICGAPRITFLCQTMPPPTTRRIAQWFDEEIAEIVTNWLTPLPRFPRGYSMTAWERDFRTTRPTRPHSTTQLPTWWPPEQQTCN